MNSIKEQALLIVENEKSEYDDIYKIFWFPHPIEVRLVFALDKGILLEFLEKDETVYTVPYEFGSIPAYTINIAANKINLIKLPEGWNWMEAEEIK